jgi:hypothetical protein
MFCAKGLRSSLQYGGTTVLELRKVLEVSNQITMLFAVLSIILGAVLLSHGLFLVRHHTIHLYDSSIIIQICAD